jgi:hypothetical protein
LQKRQELAKAPRGDADTMQRLDAAGRNVIDLACERSDPILE